MSRIQILDCTLRDGGYCNQWKFGYNETKKIVNALVDANIDIVECGFLTNQVEYVKGITKFSSIEQFEEYIPSEKNGKQFVCMLNYGEYNVDDIPAYNGKSVDGIRVAFHKSDLDGAIELCKKISQKGYKVYVQPMVSLGYTDEEFISLIYKSNQINPYAFYIVDSFGVMKRKDLIRFFYMVEHNLKDTIKIGYHSHNNMQLAYSNAQALVDIRTKKEIIIDSSVFGMGRGAGNLNMELFVEYLNDNIGANYVLKPLLSIIDEILNRFYQENYWGYSLPNYLSAAHNAHPNYASYLDEKKTLTIEGMNTIFSMMDAQKKINYDKDYIEQLYVQFMEMGVATDTNILEFKSLLKDKKVLIIAPGKSSIEQKEKVISCARKNDVVTIGINFEYMPIQTDYIFVSNRRRFKELDVDVAKRCITTSNIPTTDSYIHTSYKELLNDIEAVMDNAGMMLIQFLINMGVENIYVAGLDGYSMDPKENFAEEKMSYVSKKEKSEAINAGMKEMIERYKKHVHIESITTSKYMQF